MKHQLTRFLSARCRDRAASVPGRMSSVLLAMLFWTGGYLLAQSLVLVCLIALLLTAAFGLPWPDTQSILNLVLDIDLDRSFLLVGAPVLGGALLMLPVVRVCEGRRFRDRIGWHAPSGEEVIYSLATVAPIAIIGNIVYEVVNAWWQGEPTLWPFAAALRKSSLDQLYESFQGVSYPVLIVAMALAPAVVEELVFRGVLGRRLVQTCGTWWGVVLTSCCFALVHGSPPHAIATLPVAFLLHFLYLQTGTIWTPVLVHFCNNLLAISMVRFSLEPQTPVSPVAVLSLSFYLVMMLYQLQTRSRNWSSPLLAQVENSLR